MVRDTGKDTIEHSVEASTQPASVVGGAGWNAGQTGPGGGPTVPRIN